MQHPRASGLLTEYVSGDLEPNRRREVEEHLKSCDDCHLWVATYRLLARSIRSRAAEADSHLSSDDLSTFALNPQNVDQATRERCERHLETCRDCTEEAELVAAAVSEARQRSPRRRSSAKPRLVLSPARLAWAATLMLVIGALVVDRWSPEAEVAHLSGEIFEGEETFKGDDVLLVDASRVNPRASVILQAERTVAIGEGFSVDSGASLTVVVDQSDGSGP